MNTKQIKNLCAASDSADGGERERDALSSAGRGSRAGTVGIEWGGGGVWGDARNYATIKYNSKQSEIYRCPHWMTMIAMAMLLPLMIIAIAIALLLLPPMTMISVLSWRLPCSAIMGDRMIIRIAR